MLCAGNPGASCDNVAREIITHVDNQMCMDMPARVCRNVTHWGTKKECNPVEVERYPDFFLDIMTFKSVLVSCLQLAQQGKATILPFLLNVLILGVELLIKLLILQFWKKFAETRPSNFVKMFHETLSSQFQEKLSSKNALQSLRFDALQSKSRFQKDNVTLN